MRRNFAHNDLSEERVQATHFRESEIFVTNFPPSSEYKYRHTDNDIYI